MLTPLPLYLLVTLLFSCRPVSQEPAPAPSLRDAAPFPMGASLNPNLLTNNAPYRQTAAREYSSVTAENYLKMGLVHPAADRYDWAGADLLVSFAGQNRQRMHGHTLVWHQSLPGWVTSFTGDSTAWEGLFKTHIQTVVQHYKGRIRAWDVVNEAFNDDGTMRKTVWLDHLGPDYVARAFRYAHEADPAALLFYNEYGHEYSARKLAAVIALATDFKQRGVPINGLGLQMHINIKSAESGIAEALKQASATGLLVHISELDVALNPGKQATFAPTNDLLAQQRRTYAYVVSTYRTSVPAAQQHGITTWNIGDADSWIPGFCKCQDYPLPFDKTYQKKPAYDGILEGLK